MHNVIKKVGFVLGTACLSLMGVVFPLIPLPLLSLMFDILFAAAWPVLLVVPNFRKVVLPNIEIAFGSSLTKTKRFCLGLSVMRRLLKMIPLTMHYAHPRNHAKIMRDVSFKGLDRLKAVRKEGRGIIALTAHLGNFTLMTIAFANSDIPFVVVTKEPNYLILRDFYTRWKKTAHVRWINADTRSRATREILRELSRNTVVLLVADERKKYDGIPVPFFGRPALTAPGPAVLSLRTSAPITPVFIFEQRGLCHTVEVGHPLEAERTGDHRTDIFLLTQKANLAIETAIRRRPELWAWTNSRWKI